MLVLGCSEAKNLLPGIETGFVKCCREHEFSWEVMGPLADRIPRAGKLYIAVHDQDPVQLVKKIAALDLRPGFDVGILSYNEISFKEITANGIATISTDFARMGKEIIRLLVNERWEHIRNASCPINCNSS